MQGQIAVDHPSLGSYRLVAESDSLDAGSPELVFTENETNTERLYGSPNATPYVKDAFHDYIVAGRTDRVNPARRGTKAAAVYRLTVPAGGEVQLRLRLTSTREVARDQSALADFAAVFAARRAEADAFYQAKTGPLSTDERLAVQQAYAGLLWSKQFYHYDVRAWLAGDPAHPAPPASRRAGRNVEWGHLYNRDILSMPDKWEYPWFAAWDLAFHMIPFARIDPHFAKEQLLLMTREWYMHPRIPTGGSWCCFMNTSMARPGGAWEPATRPAGRRSPSASSRTSPAPGRRDVPASCPRHWRLAPKRRSRHEQPTQGMVRDRRARRPCVAHGVGRANPSRRGHWGSCCGSIAWFSPISARL